MAKINPGKGYRLLKIGEIRPEGYETLWDDQWEPGHYAGNVVDKGMCPMRVKASLKVPKAPKLHTWDPYELGIDSKDTKSMMLIRAQALMDAANQLGTENAKLKNTIATLRKKAAK